MSELKILPCGNFRGRFSWLDLRRIRPSGSRRVHLCCRRRWFSWKLRTATKTLRTLETGLFTCFQHCKCFNTTDNQIFPKQCLSAKRGAAYGWWWRRSPVCDPCWKPARCRRPQREIRAAGGTWGWWCKHEEGRQGGCLCSEGNGDCVLLFCIQKSLTLEETIEEAENNHVGHFTALAQRVLLGWLLLKPTQRDKFQLLWQNEN